MRGKRLRYTFVLIALLSSALFMSNDDCVGTRDQANIISIDGEEELEGSEYITSGSGTPVSPYILTGFPPTTEGISLRNITSYIVVRDHSFDTSTEAIAVRIQSVEHLTLDNISISSHDHTIYAVGRTNLTIDSCDIRDIPSLYKVESGNDIRPLKLYFMGDLRISNSTFAQRSNSSGYHLSVEIEGHRVIVKNSTFRSFYYLPLYANEDYLSVEGSTFIGTDFRPRTEGTPPIEKCLISNCTFNNSYIQLHWAEDLKIIDNSFNGPGSYIYFGSPLPRPDWIRNEIRGNTFEGSRGLFSDFPNNSDYIVNWNITENYFANSSLPAIEWRAEWLRGVKIWKNVFFHTRGTGDHHGTPQVYITTFGHGIDMSVNGVGNYWRDLTTPDEDGNGIVDIPYPIHDTLYDHFPVTNPYFDLTRPHLRILEPTETGTTNEYVVVKWEAWDEGSGLDKVLVSLDGENWTQPADSFSTSLILEEGDNTIHVKAVDRAELCNVSTHDIHVGTASGPVRIIKPEQGEFLAQGPIEVEWYVDPVFELLEQHLFLDGEKMVLDHGVRSLELNIPDGDHSLSLSCRDIFNTTITKTVFFTVDLSGPVISILSPFRNITYSNRDIRFRWAVSDGNGVHSTHFRLDGGDWTETGITGPFETTMVLEEGQHSFEVKALDHAGSLSTGSVQFSIGPSSSLVIASPPDGHATSSSPVKVQWEFKEPFTPALYVIENGAAAYRKEFDNGSFWEVPLVKNSENVLELTAYDTYGNYLFRKITVIRDNRNPTVNIENKIPYRNADGLLVCWSGTDEFGISGYLMSLDGGDWEEVGTEFLMDDIEDGPHDITVRCSDLAGNMDEDSYGFVLDTKPPEVHFLTDAGELVLHGSLLELEWEAKDHQGLDNYVLRIDEVEYTFVEGTRGWSGVLIDGYHELSIIAFDKAGNFARDTLSILVDTRDPELFWLAENPRYVNRTSYLLEFEADDDLGMDSICVRLSGQTVWSGNETGQFRVPVTLEEGSHTITIEALDISGRNATLFYNITVDTAPPVPVYLNYTYDKRVLRVHYRAVDEISGVKEMLFEVPLNSERVWNEEGTVDLGRVAPGVITLRWTLTDNAGNSLVVERELDLKGPRDSEDEETGIWRIAGLSLLALLLVGVCILAFFLIRKRGGRDIDRKNGSGRRGPSGEPVKGGGPLNLPEPYRPAPSIMTMMEEQVSDGAAGPGLEAGTARNGTSLPPWEKK